ncbi:nucleotidyltransferase domain-containing protein [Streptomyces sp. WZ-12]|uniref:nucleotidyltransferase domain-containing protein n=1 Tax=Streptomyces sp. WZ-12 TaxID=3030210 RepID=UPI0023815E7D|nr:nucleotidyltransferase domain-containing protein [Streptomyces sp. WZ-12]
MTHRAERPEADRSAPSPQRAAEVREIADRVTHWAAARPDIVGLLLVGSYARNAARTDSDVDIVLLTTDRSRYAEDTWADGLALGELVRTRAWGPLNERRHALASGLEVEVNIGPPDWARTDPVDPGTRRVVTAGARPLHDPAGLLDALIRACRP